MQYQYPNDDNLHTRFSELQKCTPGSIDNVIRERLGEIGSFQNEITEFGDKRHEMLNEYILKNKKLPPKFGLDFVVDPKQANQHLMVEMFPKLVLHGTPDVFGADWVADFKTTTRGKGAYVNSKQCTYYAWLLSVYGLDIKKIYYLCELWNPERTEILGYEMHEKDITPEDIEEVKEWTLTRARLLYQTLKDYEKARI